MEKEKDDVLTSPQTEDKTVQKKTSTQTKQKNQKKVKQVTEKPKLTNDYEIKVISNFDGKVGYVSRNQLFAFELDGYGSYDYVNMGELRAIRNGHIRFFKENWILLEDPQGNYTPDELYQELRVSNFYNNIYTPDEIEDLFNLSEDKLKVIIKGYPKSFKELIFHLAERKIINGELDSTKKREAIQNATGFTFEFDE